MVFNANIKEIIHMFFPFFRSFVALLAKLVKISWLFALLASFL